MELMDPIANDVDACPVQPCMHALTVYSKVNCVNNTVRVLTGRWIRYVVVATGKADPDDGTHEERGHCVLHIDDARALALALLRAADIAGEMRP